MPSFKNGRARRAGVIGGLGLSVALAATLVAPATSVFATTHHSNGGATDVGVTATSITIGATVPLTGPAAPGYDTVAPAANAVFNWVNKNGGINGRKIKFDILNDAYDTGIGGVPSTIDQTKVLVNSDNVFATVGSLGTPTQTTVMNYLRENGVPQLFVNSGSVYWNNASNYPDLFGWQPDYTVEGKILGHYIDQHFKGEKVGFLGDDSDFGTSALAGLSQELKPTTHEVYDATALALGANLSTQIAAFAAAKDKVVYLASIPGATELSFAAAAKIKFKPQWVISSGGSDPRTVNMAAENGALSFSWAPALGGKPTPWTTWATNVLKGTGLPGDPSSAKTANKMTGNVEYGIGWGVTFVEALKGLGPDVTRTGLVNFLNEHGASLPTPALVPLAYGVGDHQGYHGGYVYSINAKTYVETPIAGTLAQTGDASSVPITPTTALSAAIPAWLK